MILSPRLRWYAATLLLTGTCGAAAPAKIAVFRNRPWQRDPDRLPRPPSPPLSN